MNSCKNCDLCCKYVVLEIDTPETEKDFDEIKWYLLHENILIFIDNDDSWNIQFNSKCCELKNGLCSIYQKRPIICREHYSDECEKYGEGEPHKSLFKNIDDFEKWKKTNAC